ncbi:hypothetical protein GGR52DRAFT_551610 [Hypoxylon sp. FL1284]|nr:hypothetical protein GGR52DRAFT_551610 [Hypoxylon sp. FL1284]
MGGHLSTDDDHCFLLSMPLARSWLFAAPIFFIPGFRPAGKRSSLFSFLIVVFGLVLFIYGSNPANLLSGSSQRKRLLLLRFTITNFSRVCEYPLANSRIRIYGEMLEMTIY